MTAYDQDGSILWQSPVPGGGGGAPVIADLDGDGLAEIGVAGRSNYVAYNHDGSILWQNPTQDFSSQVTGSTVFDFDGDGRAEVVYGDETTLRVYDGQTGDVIYAIPNRSATASEYPVVADIDGDNHAELLVVADSGPIGLRVFEDAQDSWMPTRSIWNQYAYHISNIGDDTSIPGREDPSWLSHNSYRLNAFPDRNPLLTPDLSVSFLRVNAGTAGQPETITVRIGNGGVTTTPAPSSVSFYAGEPATGVLLGSVPIPVLAAGAFLDLTLSNPPALTGSADIFAVVDADNALNECREDNNQQSVPILLQTRDAGISVVSDAAVYLPAAAVQLSADISNNSLLPGEFKAQLRIEDLSGIVIKTFPLRDTGPVDGRASQTRQETWDSSGFLSGSYRVRAELFSVTGDKLSEATATFILRHPTDLGPAVTLSLQPDRAVYFTSDTARITQRITNLSQSTLIEAAQLSLSVADPTGRTIFTSSNPVDMLVPGALRDQTAEQRFENLAPGLYPISGELRASDGTLLANAQGSYQVEVDTTRALRGTVQVQSKILERGQTQLCTDTLSNLASQSLSAQAIRQLLIKLDTAEVLSSSDSTLTLAPGAGDSRVRSINTAGLVEGVYSCVLQAQIAGTWNTLANDVFTLIVPPVAITATLEPVDTLRLLILLDTPGACDKDDASDDDDGSDDDCTTASTDTDPVGPANAPLLSEQRSYLEDILTTQGWSYRIVTDAQAFTRELRSGGYTTYVLFSERIELEEQVQKELREAVFRGEGLLVTVTEDDQYEALTTALGIKLGDKLMAPTAISVQAVEDIGAGRADFTLIEPVRRVILQGAEAVARYPGLSACSGEDGDDSDNDSDDTPDCNAPVTALTHYRYGDGHSLIAGFDLLAQAAQLAADPLFTDLLSEALAATRPDPAISPLTGSVAAIRLTLTNQGIAIPGKATIMPPADSQTLDPGQATTQADGRLLWPFDLAENTGTALTFWLQLPGAIGPATTEVLLQVGISPNMADYDNLQLSLDPNPRPGLDEVLDTLTALATQDNAYEKALKNIQKAKDYLEQGKADKALKAALKGADVLISLEQSQATTVRRQLALAITLIERQL